MDTRFGQMVQVGERKGDVTFYFEDYAYTYLKKHSDREKLYLYGKIEKYEKEKKVYIYGVSSSPKLEKTYFKEYVCIGNLRTKGEEKIWSFEKEEIKLEGYFIFYSTNTAMQEYLIEQGKTEKETEEDRVKGEREELNIRERLNMRPLEEKPYKEQKGSSGILFVGTLGIIMMVLFGLSSTNGQKKIEVFKEIIEKELTDQIPESEEIIIEEKNITEIINQIENTEEDEEEEGQAVNDNLVEKINEEEVTVTNDEIALEEVAETGVVLEEEKIEYIVEKGDTLAWICKKFYGTTERLKEISELNNITNMDHIAPGQKLYLPN